MANLTPEQQIVADSAAKVLTAKAGARRFRALRDAGKTHDAELWEELVNLGWPVLALAEDKGGLGMGLGEVVIVMEAIGRHHVMVPLLSSLMTAPLLPGTDAAQGKVVGVAWQEGQRERGLDMDDCNATFSNGRLTGQKERVLHGENAEAFVVTARHGTAIQLFLVEARDASVSKLGLVDRLDTARVSFDNAPAIQLDATLEELKQSLESATIALAAEMLGGAQAALETTIAYLKERNQFDRTIAHFQVLQHRAVDCYVLVELARAAVLAAARTPTPELVSLAKCNSNNAYSHVAKEAIQLHGGIGMTDEHDIAFHLKRSMVATQCFGNSAYHRSRWASLGGY